MGTDDVKEMIWGLRGEGETVECARCGKQTPFEEAVPEEGDEWECFPCWERCNEQERRELHAIEMAKAKMRGNP
jgi:NAD-dependent SIR2 family protein deacetylase